MRNIGIYLIYRNAKESLAILFYEPAVKLTFYFVTLMSYLPKIIELLLRKYIVPSNVQRKINDLVHKLENS